MNWRWALLAGLLAALAVGYNVINGRGSKPETPAAAPPQPGYYLNDAVITQTQPDGSFGVRLTAQRIEQQPSDKAIAMADVRVDYFQAAGKEWVLTAQRGLAPADSRIVHFVGDVELRPKNAPDAYLRTDALTIDTERNIARAARSPATLKFGQHTLTVQSFTVDLNTEKLRMESPRGAYDPG